jgi:hypothetical protein
MMNDPLVRLLADQWGQRIAKEASDREERIRQMYLQALGQTPTVEEIGKCQRFLDRQAGLLQLGPDAPPVWSELAHVFFNVKDFIYLK